MENVDKKQCATCGSSECKGCGQGQCGSCCGMMGHGCHGGKHYLVKIILKIVIVILIFWCGFKLGEMTGFIKASSGERVNVRSGFGMMRGNLGNYSNSAPVTNPSTGTPTPVPTQ